ncbi:sulfatase family protein [Agromyces indicus]|uniref:Sulfatase n=1 Tax=Agromyces indicus TaxID=758919 RepID=A0ABU1FFP8_9MICO|nr:sulfatase [Agromyces indicus]MDR5690573.1 sulfatase [Agromyces indicus]
MTTPVNIMLITADDMEGTTPGAFGGPDGVTPRLDALATEGMVFDRAHVAIAVCQPSRSAIMTGLWPHRNGAEGFEPIDDGVPLLTELLADAGYATGILGKVNHLQPIDRFGWDTAVGITGLGMGRDPRRYADETAAFIGTAGDRPWFLMVNAHDPHRPFHGADDVGRFFDEQQRAGIPEPSRIFTPEEASPLPGYLPDLPDVRTEYAQYLSSSRRCDDVVGGVLDVLDAAGLADTTLVVFLSDNGMAFPFSKANCYLQSTHTPLIVRWPGVVEPGRREHEEFVTMLDLFPTFCEVAGLTPRETDGRSLLAALRGADVPAREQVVTVFHETSMGRRYEMRCVQDARYGYIWNGWADGSEEYRAENMIGLTWPAMVAAAESDAALAERVAFYRTRVVEELYSLDEDPASLVNLADDPAHAPELREKREALRSWMAATGDPLRDRYESLVSSAA